MKPLSKKRRFWYVMFLMIVFFMIAPLLIMYASGYRLDEAFKLAKTGGLYISSSQSGAEIYVNDDLVRRTSMFQKNVFIQNLKPSIFTILVKKEGYQEWKKTLAVFPETVTEVSPFLFAIDTIVNEIPEKIISTTSGNATSSSVRSKAIVNPDYTEIVELFNEGKKSPLLPKNATSTNDVKEFRKLVVLNVEGVLRISWRGSLDSKPSYFCRNEVCKKEIIIQPKSKLTHFDFFPGRTDLIMMSLEDGIYVSEIDDRSEQNVQKMFNGENTDFRIKNGNELFFRKGAIFYSVEI